MENRLEDPEFIKKLKYLFYILIGICIVLGFLIEFHPHYWWERIPAFFAMYGFVICLLIIFGAKVIGRLVQRTEDYYD